MVCCRCERDDTNYLDPSARMWHSKCGHMVCERCKRELFQRHRMNKCPQKGCGITLGAQDFSGETREQREYTEEKRVRKRLATVFNKTLQDFNSDAAAFNDYLEHVEVLVAQLVSGSEREKAAAEADIAAYRETNKYNIDLNMARQHAAEQAAKERQAAEMAAREAAARASAASEAAARAAAERVKQHIKAVLFGEKKIQGEDERAGIRALKEKLLAIQQAKKESGAAAGGGGAADPLGGSAAPLQHAPQQVQAYVPCATVFPPRLVAYAHPSWMQLPALQLPPSSLPSHQAAGGWDVHSIRQREAHTAHAMLWIPPAARMVDSEPAAQHAGIGSSGGAAAWWSFAPAPQ